MSLILPAFSSPDLKAFPHCSKSSNSSEGGQTGPLRVPAARQCDLFRSAFAPLHKSHRLAKARFKGASVVMLSVGLYQSRKAPYLPLDPQCVRLLPRPTGLPPMAFAVSFRIRFADAKTAVKPHWPKRADGRFRVGAALAVVPRPEGVLVDICMRMRNCLARILSCPSELPLSLRLIIYIDTLYSYSCG